MAYEQWTVDGYDLSTLAHDIITYDGLDDVPDLKIEDTDMPQGHGVIPGVAYFGAGRKAVSMMVNTVREDGTTANTPDGKRAIYDENLDRLLKVFYRPNLLDVRRVLSGGETRQAWARTVTGIKPQRVGLSAGRVVFDLQLPYSFWQDYQNRSEVVGVGNDQLLAAFDGATAPLNELDFEITGPATNPRITNAQGDWVQINEAIPANVVVTLKNSDMSVNGASLANISHEGDPRWLTLWPSLGGVSVSFSASGTDATTSLRVRGRRKWLR